MPRNELIWKVLPARNRRKLVIFLAVVLGFLSAVFWTSGLFWTLLAAAILAVSLSSFFTPTIYVMDEEGLTVRKPLYTVSREWEEIRRITVDRNGIFLSPFRKRTRMENFRGVFLIARDNVDEALAFIRERVGEDVPFIDARPGKATETKTEM
jgi:hypothetical protein